ncbi:hypothetical protein BD309DRAFT_458667 [Dichomitus squalens]|nr:hypothetical protein BD309DRAFT_458667 [Dichomitus squalens]
MGRRIEVQHRGVANVIVQDWVDQTSRLRLPNRQRLPLGALESEVSVVHHDVLRPAGYAVAHTAPKTFPVGPPPSHHRGYIDSDVPSTGQPWAREEREDVNPLGGYAGNTGRRDGRPEGAFSMGRVVKFGLVRVIIAHCLPDQYAKPIIS